MKLNNKELEAIKELIYLEIENKNGIENIIPDLNKALWKINCYFEIHDLKKKMEATSIQHQRMEFIFDGTRITDPTMDETGRFSVDPIEYYGKVYLEAIKKTTK
tara:strand:+ start:281 stop:592 length:312 start_codon:yes stop_codon:yes gene_type:complete